MKTDATAKPFSKRSKLSVVRSVAVGQKFGGLTAIERAPNDSSGRTRFRCMCSCGKEHIARVADLRSGHTKSCGCRRAKQISWRLGKLQFKRCGSLTPLGTADETGDIKPSTPWVRSEHKAAEAEYEAQRRLENQVDETEPKWMQEQKRERHRQRQHQLLMRYPQALVEPPDSRYFRLVEQERRDGKIPFRESIRDSWKWWLF